MRIVLATRELHPFASGGIAPVTAALARTLGRTFDVTIVTSDHHRAAWEAQGNKQPYGPGVEVCFAHEPRVAHDAGFLAGAQAWSAALFEAIRDRFGAGDPPDLIEFPDYLAEGFVTIQARRTGDPALAGTTVVVRTHTTAEMVSILNGSLDDEFQTRVVLDMERYCLRNADALLCPGERVRTDYERFYGAQALARDVRALDAFELDFDAAPARADADRDLRMLFVGRLERRKGPQVLLRALRAIAPARWQLSFLGGDTTTAPLGTSMRQWLELGFGDDERVTFLDPVPRREVGRVIAEHDLVVVPSLWECWPNTVREAYAHGRPVLATPVGGLPDLVEDGVSGWLAADAAPHSLADRLAQLVDAPAQVRRLHDSPALTEALRRSHDAAATLAAYRGLLDRPRVATQRADDVGTSPLVSVVVPYYRMAQHVQETLASIAAQTWPHIEVIIVNDGSFEPSDAILLDLAERTIVVTQPNRGLGAARNLGVAVAKGDFVLPLDPDNRIAPTFVETCLHALLKRPSLAYVTTWSQYIDEYGRHLPLPDNGYTPLGNWSRNIERENVAGDGTAVLRRSVFDTGHRWNIELASYEDWFFYRELHAAGLYGDVIPRRLFEYRVRAASMLRTVGLSRTAALEREMRAHRRALDFVGGASA